MNGHLTVNIADRNPDEDDNLSPSDDNNHHDDQDEFVDPDDPFDITHTKNASHDTLRRWRVIILFLSII